MSKTFQECITTLLQSSAVSDWTNGEKIQAANQTAVDGALEIAWKRIRGDDVSALFAALKTYLSGFAQGRRITPQTLYFLAFRWYLVDKFPFLDPRN